MGTSRVTVRNVAAGAVGNVLEWYDFAVYGFLAPILGAQFFPAADRFASLLGAFSVFAIGYAARPIGGALFGHAGDRWGRRPALVLSVLLMGAATCAIGLLPDRAEIGDAAPLLLVVFRVLQGMSVGGEFTGSIVFVAEHATNEQRGLLASWTQVGCTAGFLLGSITSAVVSAVVGEAAMQDWGWRVPFLLGAVIALAGLVLRRQIAESPVMAEVTRSAAPVWDAIRGYWRIIARLVALIAVGTVGFYLVFVYAASYLMTTRDLSTERALAVSSFCLLAMLLVTPVAARVSDRVGRRPLLVLFAVGLLATA